MKQIWLLFSFALLLCFYLTIAESINPPVVFRQQAMKIRRTENKVPGHPWNEMDIITPSGYNYGRNPYIIVTPNADNTITVAWLDYELKKIHIAFFNRKDSMINELRIRNMNMEGSSLAGFCRIPEDGSFVLGHTRYNPAGDGEDFYIARIKKTGDVLWDVKIFGSKTMKDDYAACCPGSGGTARIAYNPVTKNIGFYMGYSRKYPNDTKHQGSRVGFITSGGKTIKSGKEWYISHDFDQRMIVKDSLYYLLSHGDAYPRALVFSAWKDGGNYSDEPVVYTKYFEVPGKTGDNYTGSRTGGLIALSDGNFGIVFATKINREKMDICFVKISPGGKILHTKWITGNKEDDADFPKIAYRGKNRTLLAWKSNYSTAEFRELDNNGNILSQKTIRNDYMNKNTDIDFCYTHDLVTCPNGDVVWATGEFNNKKLIIYRITDH